MQYTRSVEIEAGHKTEDTREDSRTAIIAQTFPEEQNI